MDNVWSTSELQRRTMCDRSCATKELETTLYLEIEKIENLQEKYGVEVRFFDPMASRRRSNLTSRCEIYPAKQFLQHRLRGSSLSRWLRKRLAKPVGFIQHGRNDDLPDDVVFDTWKNHFNSAIHNGARSGAK